MITILWERGNMIQTLEINSKNHRVDHDERMREYLVYKSNPLRIVQRFPAERVITIEYTYDE